MVPPIAPIGQGTEEVRRVNGKIIEHSAGLERIIMVSLSQPFLETGLFHNTKSNVITIFHA